MPTKELEKTTKEAVSSKKKIFDKTKSTDSKNDAISILNDLLDDYINKEDNSVVKLANWIKTYVGYLKFEKTFIPHKNISYKRGQIVKVNLGYNVGNEEGGPHYCVVIDKNNELSSGIVTVLPLTSQKGNGNKYSSKYNILIGEELYCNLIGKIIANMEKSKKELEKLKYQAEAYKALIKNPEEMTAEKSKLINTQLANLQNTIKKFDKIQDSCDKMMDELSRMKKGSVVQVSQITTISKMRIIDPKTKHDVLNGIRLNAETLDKIDGKIKELYLNN